MMEAGRVATVAPKESMGRVEALGMQIGVSSIGGDDDYISLTLFTMTPTEWSATNGAPA